MSAWGHGPFDSDDAAGLVAELAHPIKQIIARDWGVRGPGMVMRRRYARARAAAQFIIMAHGTDILGGVPITDVLRALVAMRRDSEWIRTWRRPKLVAKQLDTEIAQVLNRMRGCRHCRRELRAAEALVAQAVPR